jgi:hypothetical protein
VNKENTLDKMLSMTGIEEIVKYQKELLNHQRNQKLIQKETIKLLNALNKNITFMSDRLDEFAQRTNIKLEMNNVSQNSSQNHPINVNTIQELNNVNSNDEFFSSGFYDNSHLNTNSNNNLNIGGTVVPVTSQQLPINLNEDIKEYYILSDCNLEPLSVVQNSTGPYQIVQNNQQIQQQQQQVLFQPPSNLNNRLMSNKINHNNKSTGSLLNAKIKSSSSRLSSSRSSRSNKLLDTTNTTGANTTATSEESLDDDLSMDETSEDEKETIQIRKKPKVSYTVTTPQSHSSKSKEYEESHNQQRLFNKYVRENVENRLGKEFLLLHEIQEIDHDVMESIKKDALEMYPPINIRPRRAWHLAKASLRCRRRSLRRQKEKQILLNPLLDTITTLNNNSPFCTSQTSQSDTISNVQTMITMAHI